MDIGRLIKSYPLISDQINEDSLEVVLENLNKVLNSGVEGDIVELGCYIGTTSLFITRLLKQSGKNKQFHVYDSFEGLPSKSQQDASSIGQHFKSGELKVTKKDFIRQFQKAGQSLPFIHKGWFSDLRENDLPEKIAFAFLDGDFYESILDSLKLVWPKLESGGVICIDDYKREALPGVERAVLDYFGTDEQVIKKANIGIIVKTS